MTKNRICPIYPAPSRKVLISSINLSRSPFISVRKSRCAAADLPSALFVFLAFSSVTSPNSSHLSATSARAGPAFSPKTSVATRALSVSSGMVLKYVRNSSSTSLKLFRFPDESLTLIPSFSSFLPYSSTTSEPSFHSRPMFPSSLPSCLIALVPRGPIAAMIFAVVSADTPAWSR